MCRRRFELQHQQHQRHLRQRKLPQRCGHLRWPRLAVELELFELVLLRPLRDEQQLELHSLRASRAELLRRLLRFLRKRYELRLRPLRQLRALGPTLLRRRLLQRGLVQRQSVSVASLARGGTTEPDVNSRRPGQAFPRRGPLQCIGS